MSRRGPEGALLGGPAGAPGPTGPTGPGGGATGPTGAAGTAGTAVVGLGFNAAALGSPSAQSYFPYGSVATSSLTPAQQFKAARAFTIDSIFVETTGNALNVGGQTATFEVLINGVSQGSVSGIATTAGAHGGSATALGIAVAAGDLVQPRISLSLGLTAGLTDTKIGLG